jgi:predicted signal transduction protein with EAL and GGDEF domain
VSQSTPPNSSSADATLGDVLGAGQEEDSAVGLGPLVRRLAEEFSADAETLARVALVFSEVRERAPDLFVPAAGALDSAFAETHSSGGASVDAIYNALGEWALDAEAEPIERMRRDCLRFQSAMTRGALRLYAENKERCTESLLAIQRFVFLQLALLASLTARGEESGGVVRTLPTPEYAAFMEIFRSAIETHKEEGSQLALLLIHVPKVEQVDRLLGLQRGEAFMLRVTRRMREGVLRKQDQLGRVSRDQLACLLPRIPGEGVAILAANKILGTLEAPIPIGDRSFQPDATIGVVVFPEHGEDHQTLVRNGKLAARAASATADRVALYDPAEGENEERKMRYEARLRHALEENELSLVFNPQLDLASGRIGALECELRWKDEELGEISEEETIETAERAGLVREVSWWLFNNGLRQCAEFAAAGFQPPLVIRVTSGGLLQPDFPDFVGRALRTWGVPPKRLVIGIHETALVGDLEKMQETLTGLKAHGLNLGIDGFGTGSSCISNLAQLPLDEMKISGEFVTDMRKVANHAKIVRSLINLARSLGLRVTADGVEDAETALALSGLGCSRVQGEYVSSPLTAQELLEFEARTAGLSQLNISDL